MRSVCVYCGSREGGRREYREASTDMGRLLAERQLRLVYGGGAVGLMGSLADAALTHGGEVIGVIPEALATREIAHGRLTELRVVPSMHARKALMADLSDAFIGLPGGLGTFEELLEILTWTQLGIHQKPLGLVNIGGYFDPLVALLDHAVAEGFATPFDPELIVTGSNPETVLAQILGKDGQAR
jgi:uncharacterized protein (TIGR00730 family)